jgi:hypothetical protein
MTSSTRSTSPRGSGDSAGAAEWVFLPYADIMYGIQAAGNRKFGLRAGARMVSQGLQLWP